MVQVDCHKCHRELSPIEIDLFGDDDTALRPKMM
jgi:hypothetical protein